MRSPPLPAAACVVRWAVAGGFLLAALVPAAECQETEALSWEERWEASANAHDESVRAFRRGEAELAAELAETALDLHPSNYDAYLARWTYLRFLIDAGARSKAAVAGEIRNDYAAIAVGDFTADQINVRSEAYDHLLDLTGETKLIEKHRDLIEEFLLLHPENVLAKPFLFKLATLFEDPGQALTAYRRILAAHYKVNLRQDLYKAMLRIAVDQPELIPAGEARALFRAWGAFLNDMRAELFFVSELYLAQAEYQLYRREDPEIAGRWLAEAQTFQEDHGFHLLVTSRLAFLLGEVARAQGDTAAARRHFQGAWKQVEPHLGDNLYGPELKRVADSLRDRLSAPEGE